MFRWFDGWISGAVVCADDEVECARDEVVVVGMGLEEVSFMRWAGQDIWEGFVMTGTLIAQEKPNAQTLFLAKCSPHCDCLAPRLNPLWTQASLASRSASRGLWLPCSMLLMYLILCAKYSILSIL